MLKAEPNSKAALAKYYKCSRKTIQAWCHYMRDNYKKLAEERNDQRYLSWEQYKPDQRRLTPLQYQIFVVHYGENEPVKTEQK